MRWRLPLRAPHASPAAAARAVALPAGAPRVAASHEDAIRFRCNLCGCENRVMQACIGREIASCRGCGSTVRFRAIGRLAALELLRRDVALVDVRRNRRLRGIGLSDSAAYALPLARAFDYENTYFHMKPRLDILDVPDDRLGRYDFVIASDVFEHVAPPVHRAFENALALLRAGGVFIFTVPFTLADDTVEHFPELHDWRIDARDGRFDLVNTTSDGRTQTFADVAFHGGPGTTLEMRVFSRAAVLRHLAAAGFVRTRIADEPCAASGIAWPEPWSVPIVAYAP